MSALTMRMPDEDFQRFITESTTVHGALVASLMQLKLLAENSTTDQQVIVPEKVEPIFALLHDIRVRQTALEQQVDTVLIQEGLTETTLSQQTYPLSVDAAMRAPTFQPRNWTTLEEYAEVTFWCSRFPWRDISLVPMLSLDGEQPKLADVDMSHAFGTRNQFFRWCHWFSEEIPIAARASQEQYVHIPSLSLENNSLSAGIMSELSELLVQLALTNQIRINHLILRSTELDDMCIEPLQEVVKQQPRDWPLMEIDLSKNNITDDGCERFLNFLATCDRYPHSKEGGETEPLVLHLKNNACYNLSIALARAEETSGLRWTSKSIRRLRRNKKLPRGNKDLAPQVHVV